MFCVPCDISGIGAEGGISMTTKRAGRETGLSQKPMNWRLWLSGIAIAGLMIAGGVCSGAQAPSPAAAQQNTRTAPAGQSAAAPAASPKDIVGTWQGTLHIPKTDQHPDVDLRLVVKISKTDAGALKAVWYSIDQGGQSRSDSDRQLSGWCAEIRGHGGPAQL